MENPIECLIAINNVGTSVQGNDPRTWMKSCAEETLLKMGDEHDFKNCLIQKMKSAENHIENPEGYANELYNEIKGKCK